MRTISSNAFVLWNNATVTSREAGISLTLSTRFSIILPSRFSDSFETLVILAFQQGGSLGFPANPSPCSIRPNSTLSGRSAVPVSLALALALIPYFRTGKAPPCIALQPPDI